MEDETYREKTGDELLWELVDYAMGLMGECAKRVDELESGDPMRPYFEGRRDAFREVHARAHRFANRKWRGYGEATGCEKVVDEVTGEAKYVKVK